MTAASTNAPPGDKPGSQIGSKAAPSLRSRLLRNVLLPLALTWLAGTAVSVLVANGFTQRAFDRSLLDDAYAMAANVRMSDETLDLALSPREIRSVLFDQVETMYFAVLRPDGSMIAGNARLPAAAPGPGASHRFSDIEYQGRSLRAVRLQLQTPHAFGVVVAETTRVRNAMLGTLLMYAVAAQLALVLLLAVWLRRAIQQDLQPLTQFQQTLDLRDARDLTPLPVEASTRDMQRLGTAVNGLLARVAQGVRAQQEFAGNVAHELRTPLAGIRALASYGLAHKDPLVWREQLSGIVQSEARASHLIDQLLSLAMADEALARQEVQLDELVRDTVLRFLPRADAAGVDLGARGLEQSVTVQAQPLLIEGILNNLIDNALRYGVPSEGEPAHITVELLREQHQGSHHVVLAVVDNGPGIPAAQHATLMQRGTQGSEGKRLGQGAGLGLSIVARYAQRLGATLELGRGPDGRGLAVRLVFGAYPETCTSLGTS